MKKDMTRKITATRGEKDSFDFFKSIVRKYIHIFPYLLCTLPMDFSVVNAYNKPKKSDDFFSRDLAAINKRLRFKYFPQLISG